MGKYVWEKDFQFSCSLDGYIPCKENKYVKEVPFCSTAIIYGMRGNFNVNQCVVLTRRTGSLID